MSGPYGVAAVALAGFVGWMSAEIFGVHGILICIPVAIFLGVMSARADRDREQQPW